MAAAEARAGWQRTANRYFVQEDAKRAPKLSPCPSSSSKSDSDSNLGDVAKGSDHLVRSHMPHNQVSSNPDLLNETKWWLHMQPNSGHPKNFPHKESNASEPELEILKAGSVGQNLKFVGVNQLMEEYDIQSYSESNAGSFVGQPWQAFPAYMKDAVKDGNSLNTPTNKGMESYSKSNAGSFVGQPWQAFPAYMKDAVKDGNSLNTPTNKSMDSYSKNNACSFVGKPRKVFPAYMKDATVDENFLNTPTIKDPGELWYADDHLFDLEPCNNYEVSEKSEKVCSEMESHWVGVEKAGPWWRTADKDELASFVSLKSLEQFENCDLPRPRPHSKHFGRDPSACSQCFDQSEVMASSDQKAEKETSNLDDYLLETPNFISMGLPFRNDNLKTTKPDNEEIPHKPNIDLSKAQLLEALCHSQTRAREAEKAAQHAHDEKEHIIKLFFRQASHLFAYKQWLQILQLETLSLQLKNNQPVSFFPWAPCKGTRIRKVRRKGAKKKVGPPPLRYKASRYAVAFAVGLGLAGAGLLLGWTMGWLFPAL